VAVKPAALQVHCVHEPARAFVQGAQLPEHSSRGQQSTRRVPAQISLEVLDDKHQHNFAAQVRAGANCNPRSTGATDRKMWRLPRPELEHQWSLVRKHLWTRVLQAWIVPEYEEKIGGNVRWLTDVPPRYTRTIT